MTVLFFDGFELYGGAGSVSGLGVADVYSGALSTRPAGRFGGFGLGYNTGASRSIPFGTAWAGPSFTFAAAFITTHVSAVSGLFRLRSDLISTSTSQIALWVTTTGAVQVTRGITAGTNVLGTSAAGVLPNDGSYHYVEFTFTLNATTGSATVVVDGITVLTLTGVNTLGASPATTVGYFTLGDTQASTVDDFYVTDGASLGPKRIPAIRPTADTATVQWTPNSGTAHFSRVNETNPDGDTSYVSSSTAGQVDLYDFADLSYTPTSISGIRILSGARKDDVASRTYRNVLKSGSTTLNSPDYAMNSSYVWSGQGDLVLTDPNTGAAWTATAINALQAGIELRT